MDTQKNKETQVSGVSKFDYVANILMILEALGGLVVLLSVIIQGDDSWVYNFINTETTNKPITPEMLQSLLPWMIIALVSMCILLTSLCFSSLCKSKTDGKDETKSEGDKLK